MSRTGALDRRVDALVSGVGAFDRDVEVLIAMVLGPAGTGMHNSEHWIMRSFKTNTASTKQNSELCADLVVLMQFKVFSHHRNMDNYYILSY